MMASNSLRSVAKGRRTCMAVGERNAASSEGIRCEDAGHEGTSRVVREGTSSGGALHNRWCGTPSPHCLLRQSSRLGMSTPQKDFECGYHRIICVLGVGALCALMAPWCWSSAMGKAPRWEHGLLILRAGVFVP